ncbi:hypothetical protein [Streptomyces sp. NPDC002054]|uniref:hypothetical protein n=1 Tax=Streptomyces sp. NPDC002054 TaxID=3154663 RepID=UPI003320E1FC
MSNTKRAARSEPEPLELLDAGSEDEGAEGAEDAAYFDDAESFEMHHATCPDCGQSIALVVDEEHLPEHALCLTPWNPFGLTVCAGTGRPVSDALPVIGAAESQELEPVVVLTLPQGLDWRTQPFSHVGGPGSRPVRLVAEPPQLRQHVRAA